ncbi:DNA-binding protein [Niastella koreensis]|uniref:Cold-shock DNA-binding protein family n=2 Tax=Niastella koreensis TaxID=354356 RepID=G8TFR8_NIAKG|nr:cold shock domain-containing protein [Niastella koreensis]AEV99507.1 cold-shock DNA-binding protein family [Niastella koreensis GR20-10]OQP50099.1 DNA-binding protein [Niastella koreensis]
MAKSQEPFTKRDRERQRQKKQQDKREKMKERKAKGKSGDMQNMLAYLDENGNLTNRPPDPRKMKTFRQEDIQISVPKSEDRVPDLPRKGTVSFFNTQKGFGFIIDAETRERIFVHVNDLSGSVQENDKVTFLVQNGPKGLLATDVSLAK